MRIFYWKLKMLTGLTVTELSVVSVLSRNYQVLKTKQKQLLSSIIIISFLLALAIEKGKN